MANTFAFVESRGGELRRVGLEAVTAARQLADATGGGDVHALVAGAPGIAARADAVGASQVIVERRKRHHWIDGGHRGRTASTGHDASEAVEVGGGNQLTQVLAVKS